MKNPRQLRYIDQLCLFKLRGVQGINLQVVNMHNSRVGNESREALEKDIHTLKSISYYELKRYAYPFWDDDLKKYVKLRFDELIARYYRDKKLRQSVLHAIEDIEIALNTRIAYILGEKLGAFGYLDFWKWCQRSSQNRYLNMIMDDFSIEKEQLRFLSGLQYKVKKSSMIDIENYVSNNSQIFPPVWMMVNVLTLGDSIHIVKLMSRKNREKVADSFKCSVKELIGWLECLNLIRNICCHNGNLIDFRLRTTPMVPEEYRNCLYSINRGNRTSYTNKLAIIIVIIVKMMKPINPKYKFGALEGAINTFSQNNRDARSYGFSNKASIKTIFD